eukprot:m51a1_g11491 putative meckel syndrome type 1 (278) ;mRNA; f:17728-18561
MAAARARSQRGAGEAQAALLPLDPAPPEPGGVRLLALGQLAAVEGAGGEDGVCVECLLDLPQGWQLVGGGPLASTTQRVAARLAPGQLAHVGHPLEVFAEAAGPLAEAAWPRVLFVMRTVATWLRRSAVVGYAHASLPRHAGTHAERVQAWAPVGSVRSRMSGWFLGGSPELTSAAVAASGATKMALRTAPSCALHLHWHCIVQVAPAVAAAAAAAAAAASTGPQLRAAAAGAAGLLGAEGTSSALEAEQGDAPAVLRALERVRQRVESLRAAKKTD